jgi:hypothetical protein
MSEKASGERVACPNCAELIHSRAVVCRFCQRGLSDVHFKKCPYCAEMVRRFAKRCRFCESSLVEPPGASGRPPQGAPVPRVPNIPQRSAAIALALPTPEKTEDSDENKAYSAWKAKTLLPAGDQRKKGKTTKPAKNPKEK